MKTVTVAIGIIVGRYSMRPELIQAGAFFIALPMSVLVIACQKYLIKGLLAGAIKE